MLGLAALRVAERNAKTMTCFIHPHWLIQGRGFCTVCTFGFSTKSCLLAMLSLKSLNFKFHCSPGVVVLVMIKMPGMGLKAKYALFLAGTITLTTSPLWDREAAMDRYIIWYIL